jgi:hypothetical protein
MATISKRELSGAADGKMVKVAQTATPGTLIHTATSGNAGADDYDEIWLWAVNSDTTARKLTIEWGGTASPDDTIEVTIPPEAGLVLVVPGLILENSQVVRAFCAAANVVMVAGYVNRMTP